MKRRSLSGKGEKQTRVIAREGDGLFCFVLSEETTVDMRDSGKLNREEKVENTGKRMTHWKNPEMKVNHTKNSGGGITSHSKIKNKNKIDFVTPCCFKSVSSRGVQICSVKGQITNT